METVNGNVFDAMLSVVLGTRVEEAGLLEHKTASSIRSNSNTQNS
jgi:hypothetical protein